MVSGRGSSGIGGCMDIKESISGRQVGGWVAGLNGR